MATNNNVEKVLQSCPPEVKGLAEELRGLVRQAAPKATERGYTGWGNLAYDHNGRFCYIAPLKNSVNMGFHRGVQLADPEGLLRGSGKGMRHVKVRKHEDIRADAFGGLIRQAYRFNGG